MDLSEQILSFINAQTEHNTEPDSYSISYTGDSMWETDDEEDIVIDCSWRYEDKLGRDLELLYPDDKLYNTLDTLLEKGYNSIQTKHDSIDISGGLIKENPKQNNISEKDPIAYEALDSEYIFTAFVTVTKDNLGYTDMYTQITSEINNRYNIDVIEDDISTITLAFSDWECNELRSAKTNVSVKDVTKIYDITSEEEYLQKTTNNSEEYLQKSKQDKYTALVRLDFMNNNIDSKYIPANIVTLAENRMKHVMDNAVQMDTDHTFEAESITYEKGRSEEISFHTLLSVS